MDTRQKNRMFKEKRVVCMQIPKLINVMFREVKLALFGQTQNQRHNSNHTNHKYIEDIINQGKGE